MVATTDHYDQRVPLSWVEVESASRLRDMTTLLRCTTSRRVPLSIGSAILARLQNDWAETNVRG
uniref:WGS project CBMF000000000 data, contig CS5834_c000760 n=1 Tax=Fusarium pseudograminearum CS5834 TaxID=1318459 RepID=A0A096PF23_FUSPS|nr:unnamed protein product [Fusarium pseudograminearum CS5834]